MAPSPIVPIIGGGPAGMSCALWLNNYGLHPILIEQASAPGGMARRNPYPNPWLLGWPGAMAREHAEAFARHIAQAGVETRLNATPQRLVRGSNGSFTLEVLTGGLAQSLSCRALVIATGTEFRGDDWLDHVPNARVLAARGRVHVGAAAVGESGTALGTHVAIVGGGDNAFDVAHILIERGIEVTIVMRAKTPRAQRRLIERVRGRADVRAGCSVEGLEDAGGKVELRLSDGARVSADHVVLLFGYRPNTGASWLADLALKKNADGYLIVNGNIETSCAGVFAVGDVSNPAHPCVATAVASGTMAAREIQRRLV
jgi:thioredoxin reductase (NADPH)